MARKLKVTGFTRFLIAMLFIVPIAYLVASYANGEDGIGKVKEIFGSDNQAKIEQTESGSAVKPTADCDKLLRQVEQQERRIEELERENERLREGS